MSNNQSNHQFENDAPLVSVTFTRTLDKEFRKKHLDQSATLQLRGEVTPLNSHRKNPSDPKRRIAAPALTARNLFLNLPTLASRKITYTPMEFTDVSIINKKQAKARHPNNATEEELERDHREANTFALYLTQHPFRGAASILISSLMNPRGPAEWITLLTSIGIINFLFKAPLIFLAQGAQAIGGMLSNPFHKVWSDFKRGSTFANTTKLLCSLPFWAIAQTFHYIGNTLSYAILVVDSIVNMITIGLGWFIGDKTRYEDAPFDSLKTFAKNLVLLIPAAIISVLSLVPGFQFLPALASSLAAILPASIKIAAAIIIPAATGFVAQLYLGIMEKLEHWMEKKLHSPMQEPAYLFNERADFEKTEQLKEEQAKKAASKDHPSSTTILYQKGSIAKLTKQGSKILEKISGKGKKIEPIYSFDRDGDGTQVYSKIFLDVPTLPSKEESSPSSSSPLSITPNDQEDETQRLINSTRTSSRSR